MTGVDAIDFKGMEPLFAHLKAELDEGIGDEPGDNALFETSMERLLAATHRQESISPACKLRNRILKRDFEVVQIIVNV